MSETEILVQQAKKKGRNAEIAAEKLVARGVSSISHIIAAVRSSSDIEAWQLSKVLFQIRDPDIVPIYVDLINDKNLNLVLPAIRVLGWSRDSRALLPLTTYLADIEKGSTRRSLAVDALGELGYGEAISSLIQAKNKILEDSTIAALIKGEPLQDDQDIDESDLSLLLSLAVALAKLGDHSMTPVVLALTHYRSADVYSDDQIVRTKAADALKYVVAPGLWRAMVDALQDEDYEVRMKVTDAMFYLGAKEVIEKLIAKTDDENSHVRENALIRISDLTGVSIDRDTNRVNLEKWWRNEEQRFSTGVCYRMGKPIRLAEIIELLATPRWRRQITQELQVVTGNDFGFSAYVSPKFQGEVLERARKWWVREGGKYEEGQLFKYGHKQDITSVFDDPGESTS
jgi:HEAT repeat protein